LRNNQNSQDLFSSEREFDHRKIQDHSDQLLAEVHQEEQGSAKFLNKKKI
jgi:hypothetical protein